MAFNVLGKKEKKHVLAFRRYKPSLEDQFEKPKQNGRKPSDRAHKKNLSLRLLLTDWKIEKRSQKKSQDR